MSKFPLNANCFVTSVTLPFLRKYGSEALDWDPLIVRDAFEGGFHQKMPQKLFDKLNCGLSLIGTDLFTATIEGFLTGCACMNNHVLDSSEAPYVNLKECAWGVWEYINLNGDITPDSRPTETFSSDIVAYIREVGRVNGISKFPVWLEFANPEQASMPDMGEDPTIFEAYMARQEDYISDLNDYVTARQKELTDELQLLAKEGLVG